MGISTWPKFVRFGEATDTTLGMFEHSFLYTKRRYLAASSCTCFGALTMSLESAPRMAFQPAKFRLTRLTRLDSRGHPEIETQAKETRIPHHHRHFRTNVNIHHAYARPPPLLRRVRRWNETDTTPRFCTEIATLLLCSSSGIVGPSHLFGSADHSRRW